MGSQLDELLYDANASKVESTDDDWGDISYDDDGFEPVS